MATETLEDKKPEEETHAVSNIETKDEPEVEQQKSEGEDGKQEQKDEMGVERPQEQEISNEVKESSGEIAKSENIILQEKAHEDTKVKEEGGDKREEQSAEMKEENANEENTEEEDKKDEEPKGEENAGKTKQLDDDGKEKIVEEKGEEDEEVEESNKLKAKVGRKRSSFSAEDLRDSKKRGQESQDKKKSGSTAAEKKKENDANSKDPVTPTSDRPTRERKTVERFSVPSPAGKSGKTSAGKALSIETGRGTQLKDIPNVAFKLSKRKPDENLQTLHTILFGKKAKAHLLKRDIGQFSGYVWAQNEEKQRAKVKEKLDKCVKEKLLDFCDVLNIPISKGSAKKEELSVKIIEFLELPCVTTEVLLADREQKGQKRRRNVTPSKSVGEGSTGKLLKKQKQTPQTGKKQKLSSETEDEDDNKAEPCGAKDDSADGESESLPNEENYDEKSKSEEEEDKPKANSSIKRSSYKKVEKDSVLSKISDKAAPSKGTPAKGTKSSEKSSNKSTSKKGAVDSGSNSGSLSKSKVSVSERQNVEKEQPKDIKEKATSKKQANKPTAKVSTKDQGKNKSSKRAKNEPSRDEMHAVVVNILKEVDFNTATLSDILRQLGTHFDQDLMHRKAEVKDIITDVINSTSDEDEEDDEDNAEDRE